jgi:hypothetical protein
MSSGRTDKCRGGVVIISLELMHPVTQRAVRMNRSPCSGSVGGKAEQVAMLHLIADADYQ